MDIRYTTALPGENDLFALYERLGWNGFLQRSSKQLLTAVMQSYYSAYAYHGSLLVAAGRVVSDGVINAYACGLGVLPEYRRQGIGTMILKMLKDHCDSNKLHMQFMCEERLVAYYDKLGYKKFAVGMK